MIPLSLNFNVPISSKRIMFGDGIFFLGSCFSDEIAAKVNYSGLNVSSNPFGTIFHPLALSRFIIDTIDGINEERIIQRDGIFYSLDASTVLFSENKEELIKLLGKKRDAVKNFLETASFVFITLGTAFAYIKNDDNLLVANCHKLNQANFNKELSQIDKIVSEMGKAILKLKSINPTIKVVFTVSPVRHIKDGIIENNRSKAILIEAVRLLEERFSVSYFPSYELVVDVLRDYRFYGRDLVHPNDLAIDFVWEKFMDTYFDLETRQIIQKVNAYNSFKNHRTIINVADSKSTRNSKLEELKSEILRLNQNVILG